MHVTRFDQAPEYFPPHHSKMKCVRLQGKEAGATDVIVMGVSIIQPGGRIDLGAAPHEKHYVVLEGELSLSNGQDTVVLGRFDSCRVAANEPREVYNHSDAVALILLAQPLPPESPS